jgi:hypothetical protein
MNEILQKKRAQGERFGKIQAKLAEILGVSVGQVSKIQKIDHCAIPKVKEAIASGEVSISIANQIAKLPVVEQSKLIETTPITEISAKTVQGNTNITLPETVKRVTARSNEFVTVQVRKDDWEYLSENRHLWIIAIDALLVSEEYDTESTEYLKRLKQITKNIERGVVQ